MIRLNYKYLQCRLCLCNNGTLCDIHQSQVEHGSTVAGIISDLLQCNVSYADGYPQLVCLECLNKLRDYKKFKDRCQNAKSKFEMSLRSNILGLDPPKSGEKSLDTRQQDVQIECNQCCMKFYRKQDSLAHVCEYRREKLVSHDVDLRKRSRQHSTLVISPTVNISCGESPGMSDENPVYMKSILCKVDNKKVTSLESSACHVQNDLVTDAYVEQHVEERELTFECDIEENVTQESNKQFEKENGDKKVTENLVTCPRTSSLPSYTSNTEKSSELNECIPNQKRLLQKINVITYMHENKEEKKGFFCKSCGNLFTCEGSLEAHVMQKHMKKPENGFCEICRKYYAKVYIKTHMNMHFQPYVCEFCKKGFGSKTQLTIHTLRKHAERKFQCKLCPRRFPTEISLAKHTRTHRQNRPFHCKLCMCGFYNEKALEKHTAKHAVEVPFQCNECRKDFDHKRKISKHIWYTHMPKPHACNICKRTFAFKSALRNHMTLHTGEKNYMCEVCGKKFRKQSNLKIHRRVHTGEKPYQCAVCDKRFTQKGSVTSHMKSHCR